MGVNLPSDPVAAKFPNLGSVVGQALPYIYTIAGITLLFMLIWGGISLMTAAGDPDKVKEGYGRIVSAIIGFLIIAVSYFVVQIIETVFGYTILK